MIEFQRLLLGDRIRNAAFEKALREVIRPGESIVADIGSGTGYLSFLALKLGAKECHLYEYTEAMLLSRELARKNKLEKQCRFYHQHSLEVKNPVKADIVISETLGNYALEENIIETLRDARRFLKPTGTIIPQSLTQYVAPVTSDRLWKEINVWDTLGHNLDFGPAKVLCMDNMYVKTIQQEDLLPQKDAVKEWDTIDFRDDNDSIRQSTLTWKIGSDVSIHGFAVFWNCSLLPGISLSTSPVDPLTHWQQIYLPVLDPVQVSKGETLELHLHSDTRMKVKVRVKWTVRVRRPDGSVRFEEKRDMGKGM